MSITATALNNQKVIKLEVTKFDVSNMQKIKQSIMEEIETGSNHIILDFSDVEFVDSSGLSVVIATFKQLNSIDGTLQLCGLQEQPLELLQITQLHKIFEIIDSCGDQA